jgi:hypothetical protein
MNSEARFEGITLDLLKHLKSKKEALEARHKEEQAELDKEIEAVSITLRLLHERADTAPGAEETKPTVIPNTLIGKSAREACIEIAKNNGGRIRVADAKDALVAARILKPSKNTWAIVYTTLQRSKEFEKTAGSGMFRLVVPAQPTDAQASFLQ